MVHGGTTGSSQYEDRERSRSCNDRNLTKNSAAPLNVVDVCHQCVFCTYHPGSSERGHEATLASGWRGKERWAGTQGDEALLDPTGPGAHGCGSKREDQILHLVTPHSVSTVKWNLCLLHRC